MNFVGEYLNGVTQNIVAALLVAVGIDFSRRSFEFLKTVKVRMADRLSGAPAPAAAPPKSPATAKSILYRALCFLLWLLLIPVIAALGFIPSLGIVAGVYDLGQNADKNPFEAANFLVMFWPLMALYIWIQLTYVMRIRRPWAIFRYTVQTLLLPIASFAVTAIIYYVAQKALPLQVPHFEDYIVLSFVSIWFLGAVSFAMPVIHAKTLTPFFGWFARKLNPRNRPVIAALGNAAFVLFVVALIAACFYAYFELHIAAPTPVGQQLNNPVCSNDLDVGGHNKLSYNITAEGRVENVEIAESSGSSDLDALAVKCVESLEYEPAMQGGKPVEYSPQDIDLTWTPQTIPAKPVGEQLNNPACGNNLDAGGVNDLSYVVTAKGRVAKVAIAKSSGSKELDALAVKCVATLEYEPATQGGKPVDYDETISLKWEPSRPEGGKK
jgi:TonB family protein